MALAEALCCAVEGGLISLSPLAPIRSVMFGLDYCSIKWQIFRFVSGILVGWTIAGYLYH